jgi:hypothetical protein
MSEFLALILWGFLAGFLLLFVLFRLFTRRRIATPAQHKKIKAVLLRPVYLDGERAGEGPPPVKTKKRWWRR